ncbi:hypothetical protein CBR_g5575 [Chara braunii]|uniref:C3H1-type domain-containing protein n=1 Tax=Chara braunii TaxID=69332 RepID=A0A388JRI3_CHABU|nr:hypothetical protein CBR_g5575 [Chara braunii]|eukprot:GBG60398.1 hypothetical protein CBR_g5575 [Chara braunii]
MEAGGALVGPSPRERIGDQCQQQQKQQDCRHFLQTGTCAYGRSCKHSHPITGRAVFASLGSFTSAERRRGEEQQQHQVRQQPAQHPERPGQPECPHYAKTGTCKFGISCKFHHSPHLVRLSPVAASTTFLLAAQSQAQRVGGVVLNGSRYPLRPGQKDCDYYMKTGQCKFGVSCKFNHPELIAASSRAPVYPPPSKPAVPIPVPTPTVSAGYQTAPGALGRSGPPAIPVSPVVFPVPVRPVGLARFPPFSTQPGQAVPSGPGHVHCLVQHPGGIVYLPPGWNYQYVWPAPADPTHLLSRPQSHQVNSAPQSQQQQQHAQPMSAGSAAGDGGSFFLPPRSHLPPPPRPPLSPPPAATSATVSGPGGDSLASGGLGVVRGGGTVIPVAGPVAPFAPSSNPGLLTANPNVNFMSKSTEMPPSLPALPKAPYPPGMIGVQGIMPSSHNGPGGCTGVVLFPQLLPRNSAAAPFPERPGQLECRYYVRTGACKYGMSCRYHHPKDRKAAAMASGSGSSGAGPGTAARCALNPMGFPLRPGQPPCTFYVRNGDCKFGQTCKFDHPVGELEYCPSASSLVDMPVAPLPERSLAVAAEEENGVVEATLHKPKQEVKGQSTGGSSEVNRPDDEENGGDNDDEDDDDEEDVEEHDLKGGRHQGGNGADSALKVTAEEVNSAPIQAVVIENSGLVSVGSH